MKYPPTLRDRPVFICGHPKSGTSLLRAIFDSHPQLVVYPEETVFFRRYLPKASGLDLKGQLELAEKYLIHIFTWNRDNPPPSQEGFPDRDYSHIPVRAIRQAMWQIGEVDYRHPGDILSAVMLAYGQVTGQANENTLHWVEKSPYNEYYAGQIFSWWPEARCIHILRDPRDNFASYQLKHASWGVEFFAANWNRSTRAGMQNQERFGAGRYTILRYEDLVQSPEASLKKLTEFLQIEWNPSLASPTRAGSQWQGNSMFADQFQSISAAPVARWKDKLSPQEAAIIEWMAGDAMQAAGYRRETPPAFSTRLRALTWPLRRRFISKDQP